MDRPLPVVPVWAHKSLKVNGFYREVILSEQSFLRAGASGSLPGNLAAAGFLVIALVLGGGGSPAPLPELILELLAVLFALIWLFAPIRGLDWQRIPWSAWMIAALVTAVPLLQLIPLPPIVWQNLPGRVVEVQALALIGAEDSWRTWSLAPSRTLSSFLSLGPPLLMLIVTSALDLSGRVMLLRSIMIVVLAMLFVGTLQLSAGAASPIHFYGATEQWLVGFQANHNSAADVLLIALMITPVVLRDLVDRRILSANPGLVLGIAGSVAAVLSLAVVLTASRMGMFLLPIPLLTNLWILRPWIRMSVRSSTYGIIGLIILGSVGLLLWRENPTIVGILVRFDFSEELRPQLWRDGLYVAQKYFPFGVGMGDFVPALIADERLEVVWPSLPNRAHNDFIELACEAGMFGLLALSAISLTLSRALWQKLRGRAGQPQTLAIFAGVGLTILSLHSLVDYPIRSMALACLAAVCAGLLLTPQKDDRPASDAADRGKTR